MFIKECPWEGEADQGWAECRRTAVSADSMGALELEWPFRVAPSWAEMDQWLGMGCPWEGCALDEPAPAAEAVLGEADGKIFEPIARPVAEASPSWQGACWAHLYVHGALSTCQ